MFCGEEGGERERKVFCVSGSLLLRNLSFWVSCAALFRVSAFAPPAHVIARGGHRRGGGVGKERGEGQRGARGETVG